MAKVVPPVPRRIGNFSRDWLDFFEALRNAVGGDGTSVDPSQAQGGLTPVAPYRSAGDGLSPVAAASGADARLAPVAVSVTPDNLAPVAVAGGGNGSLDPVVGGERRDAFPARDRQPVHPARRDHRGAGVFGDLFDPDHQRPQRVIRRATPADLPRIVEMGRRNYEARPNRGDYDPQAAGDFVNTMLASPHAAVFLSDAGMIGGMLCPYWAAPNDVQAVELFWFASDGSGRALLMAFEEWAQDQGADEVRITSRPTRALERMGYEPVDTVYRRRF